MTRARLLRIVVVAVSSTLAWRCGGDGGGGGTPSGPSNAAPTASFTMSPGGAAVASATVLTFTASGSDPNGDPVSFAWQFGDGQTGSGQTVTHSFASAGAFNVVLTATDGKGGSTSANNTVTVKSLTGTWVDADPRVRFELNQSGANLSGSREANPGSGFITSAALNGNVSNPRLIAITIHFRAQGTSSDCRYEGTLDDQADGFHVDRIATGIFCGQTSYTVRRQ